MKRLLFSLAIAAAGMAVCTTMSAVEIIAHRGASYDAPENSLSAFKLGYKQKADGCELDVHLTKDGKVVVMHDPDTGRTTGKKGKIVDQNFDDLRKLPVGNWGKFTNNPTADKIPTLDDALALIPDGKKFFLEIKCGSEILPEFSRIVKASGKKVEQLPIIGFGYETMRDAKKMMPEHKVYWLVSADKNKKFPPLEELIAKAKAANLDGLDLNYGFPIDKEFVKKVHAAGLGMYTWTVDDAAVAKKHVEAGVDGITTNRPEWLREQLKK